MYKIIVDKEITRRMKHYIEVWGLKCNPFVYHSNIERITVYHGVEMSRLYELFVNAYVNAGAYFYMEYNDLVRALKERNIKDAVRLIEKGLACKVLVERKLDGERFIGLNPNLSPW